MPNRLDRIYNTNAVILRRSNFAESDRLLIVFTSDQGKQRLIAKGIRKTKSRKAGHLELFMHTRLQVSKGRDLDIITQADLVEAYRDLREDLDKLSRAYYVAELVDQFTEDGDANFAIFELLVLTLGRLSDAEINQQFLVLRFFELKILGLNGYQPQLLFCLNCNQPIQAEVNYFSVRDGGLFCPQCGHLKANTYLVPVGALKVLRFMQTHDWENVQGLQLTETTQNDVEILLRRYMIFLLECNLKSLDFLMKLHPQC